MAFRLSLSLLVFAALILLGTKLRSTATVAALIYGDDAQKLKLLQDTLDRVSEALPIARLTVSPTFSLLIDFSQLENSRAKSVLNRLFSKLKAETHTGLGKLLQSAEKKTQEFWLRLEAERAKLASGDQSELIQEIWTPLKLTEWPEASADYRQGLHSELLVKLIDLIREYLLETPTGSGEKAAGWCRSKELALNMNSLLELFSFDRQGELFRSLQARAMDLFELCKPVWDEQFIIRVETSLDKGQRELMSQLFDNLVSHSGLFRTEEGKQPNSSTGFDFITLSLFKQFISGPLAPASVLHFLLRHYEAQFQLDDNMKNRALTMKTYKQAVDELLTPLCWQVCKQLSEPEQFYLNLLYDNELLDQNEAHRRLFLGGRDPDREGHDHAGSTSRKVDMWLASTAISCLISNSKVAKSLHTKIFNDIRFLGKSSGDRVDSKEEALVSSGEDYENELARIDEEFARNRRDRFLKESGFKRRREPRKIVQKIVRSSYVT